MAHNRKLITDRDFQEAMEKKRAIRVFQDDHVVDAGGLIIRYDDDLIVIQTRVSDIAYHRRADCEFFEMKSRG